MRILFLLLLTFVLAACASEEPLKPVEPPVKEDPEPSDVDEVSIGDFFVARSGDLADQVMITSLEIGGSVTSPIELSGEAPGNWFFEGSAPVSIVNWNGLIIGEGYVTAKEWMTTDIVPFAGKISFTFDPETPYDRGWIIFESHNASGEPENANAIEMPIFFE